MKKIEDECVKFYFQHEDLIREWAALEEAAVAFSHKFLIGIKAPLDKELRKRFGNEVQSSTCEDAKYAGISLRKAGWAKKDGELDVRLEWEKGDCLLTRNGRLWVGIETGKKKYFKSLKGKAPCPYSLSDGKWMPAYKHVDPIEGPFWEDDGLKRYQSRLVCEMLAAWEALSDLIDKAVG